MISVQDIFCKETLGFLAASAALKYAILYAWHQKRPENVQIVGRISGLYLHPVKSCGTLSIQEAQCEFSGMYSEGFCDRTWMITLKQGDFYRFITARRQPTIELIQPSFHGDYLHLDAPGMETLKLPKVIHKGEGTLCNTDLWGRKTQGVDCSSQAAHWIRRYLKTDDEYHLLYFAPEIEKGPVMKDIWANGVFQFTGKKGVDKVSFQDMSPFSLGSDVSLKDLNDKLEDPVSMRNFRMNIAVENCSEPYDEDCWDDVWIGDAKFTKLFVCDRCTQTTIDPDTAERHPKQEPKATLEKYRKLLPKAGPMFGISLVANKPATIRVGDLVYATKVDKIDVGTTGLVLKF